MEKIYLRCTKCLKIKPRHDWVENYEVPEGARVQKTVCPRCSRVAGGYYEAIIQLRGDIDDKLLNLSDKLITGRKSFYRFEVLKEGIDLYIERKDAAKSIAEQLKRTFKCELKKSYKLVTKKQGKEIYRSIISVRLSKNREK